MSPARLVMPTRILIVGFGGREHALAWKLAGEPGVNTVWVMPGSQAIAAEPRVEVWTRFGRSTMVDGRFIASLAGGQAVELVVIGPEAPLEAGVVDALLSAGIPTFGPTAAAARIEWSKSFCREIAEAAGVPMARGRGFGPDEHDEALSFVADIARGGAGVVVKADGLAAGKGVTVCRDREEAAAAIRSTAGPLVIEERLIGREVSLIAIVDRTDALAFPFARDHKRLSDGDSGPNTGGMGAYSPVPDVPEELADELVERFHKPVLAELTRRGTPFTGALYAGLMMTAEGPRLLEFNARFGDPETQVILPRLAAPLGPILLAAARGRLKEARQALDLRDARLPVIPGASVGIVLATAGYPATPADGQVIQGIEAATSSGGLVFHSGTNRDDAGAWRTHGGRVLTVVAHGPDLAAARVNAESAADLITFDGLQRRHDIGADGVPAGAAS
jgi:phosphoribosylamine--glycine ligase